MGAKYYMLIASLPHLPHFRRAERLPINPQRLRWRRSALTAEDAADLDLALDVLHWPRHSPDSSDARVDAQYRFAMQYIRSEALRSFVDDSMGQRSVLAGLRRKARKLAAPTGDEPCGVGRWRALIHKRWDRDDFGLSSLFPWLTGARSALDQDRATELDDLLMDVTWRRASREAEADPFGFPAVFAYVFKWDILSRRLSRDAALAASRFTQMVDEVINEQQTSPAH